MNEHITSKSFDELQNLAKPLQEWLVKNFDPYSKVEIDFDGVRIVSGMMFINMPVDMD